MNSRVSIFLFIDFTQVQESEKQKLEIKFKNIFLSCMSHNLKTPLNSLIINNEILQTQVRDRHSLAYDILQRDHQNMTMLNYLVSDILDFSRLYSNEFRPHCTYFNLEHLLANMKSLFLDQARQKGLSIRIGANRQARGLLRRADVFLDRQRISQVLSNLIQNSIKYSYHGTILIKVRYLREGTEDLTESEGESSNSQVDSRFDLR